MPKERLDRGKAEGTTPPARDVEQLIKRDIPPISETQLQAYTPENIQLRTVRNFDPQQALEKLRTLEHELTLAFDIGGKKISGGVIGVHDGKLINRHQWPPLRSEKGNKYLGYIKNIATYTAEGNDIAVGISFAGPIDKTKPIVGTNIPTLQEELEQEYEGDFKNIFPKAASVDGGNDAETGLVAGTMEAFKTNPHVAKVLYIINGGGLGTAIWKKGVIQAAEGGHVPVAQELNPLEQKTPCGLKGSPEPEAPCIERVIASGAGIEALYEQKTGEKLEGEEISQKYQAGDQLATDLYDTAALGTATAIIGLDKATETEPTTKTIDPETTVVVCHGGIFYVPGFADRMEQILEKNLGYKPTLIYTKDFTKDTSGNACLDGAAILALTSLPQTK